MRITFSLLTLVMIATYTLSFRVIADDTDHHQESVEHLAGVIDKTALLEPPFRTWFEKSYERYSPNNTTIEALTESLNGIRVQVFMGTWCHDSKREVPRIYKILESSSFNLNNVSLVALNLDKETSNGLEKGLDIQRTPTFIFFRDGAEIGRIVETPRESLEQDILKIVSGQEYKHSYE